MESASVNTLLRDGLVDGVSEGFEAVPRLVVPRAASTGIVRRGWIRVGIVATFDLLAAAALLGVLEGTITPRVISIALVSAITLGCAGAHGARWRQDVTLGARFMRLSVAGVVSLWIGSALASVFWHQASLDRLLAATVALPVLWVVSRAVADTWFKAERTRTLLVGAAPAVEEFVSVPAPECGSDPMLVGHVSDGSVLASPMLPQLGTLDELSAVLAGRPVDRVMIVGGDRLSPDTLVGMIRACDFAGVEVEIGSRAFAGAPDRARMTFSRGLPFIRVRERHPASWQHAAKRTIDVAGALVLGVLLLPLLAIVGVVALVGQGRPLFFRQNRVGRDEREFSIVKFRTMAPDAEKRTNSFATDVATGSCSIADAVSGLKDAARVHVTPLGALLRKTSLDELPQLWNVIRGDMSLIGPRPLRRFEQENLEPWVASQRAMMRPGITGAWQVRGRSDIDWHERINLDYSQVRNWSLTRDAEILVETLPAMLKGR